MKNTLRVPCPRIPIIKRIMILNMCTPDTLDGKCLLSSMTIPKCCPETPIILLLIIADLLCLHLSSIDMISFLTVGIKTIKEPFLHQKRGVLQVRIQVKKQFKKR
jgi:hypothetical protein